MLAEAAKIGYTIGEKYAKATNSGGCAMIHDIEPKHLYNEWKPNAVPKRSSAVVQFCGRNLLCRIDDNGLKLPSRAMFPDGDERFTYLFELDGREYYLLRDETPRGPDGWTYRDINIFRTEQPKEIAFAAVSPLVTFLARRIGIDMSILLALLCIAAGDAIRSFGGGVGIWLGTVVFASAIAVGNVLVPVIAKRDYAGHVAMATGVYSGCITAGSATAGLLSAPLAQMWGGWRASLAFWSVPPLVVAVLWALRILHNRKVVIASAGGTIETSDTGDIDDIGDRSTTANAQNPHSAQRPACSTQSSHGVFTRVLRRPMTWYVTAFMGLQSSAFYTMSNWMPSISASIGYDASTAGVHLFIFQGIGIFSGLLIPKFMNVRGNQVCAALTASAPMLIAGLGMLLLPHLMPVWAFVGGCAQGASLVVALALIALRGRDSAETVVLSGVAQSFGYLIASLGPLMFGVLVQATGGHHVPLMVFTFVAFLQCVVAVVVGRPSKM